MVIDLSDDEDEEPQPVSSKAEFEKEEEEIDPSRPYHDVLRHLDVPLGSPSLRLATPHLPSVSTEPSSYPALLGSHIVIAVACADLSIRLVSLPLLPPAPGQSDLSILGVQVVKLIGSGSHQDLITSIALTHTSETDESTDETEDQAHKWSFLIASTSCTGSGLLLIHQLPVNGSRLSTENEHQIPIRRQHPRLPLVSAKLSFNTSKYPAERHSTLLVTLPDASCVKVYQVFRQQTSNRSRRGSVGTTDSASSTRSTPGLGPNNGRFLITLLPDFSFANGTDPNQRRRKVLDAKWILGGRAIIVLLQGGEWGVWDLEAAGPVSSNSSQNLIKGQGNVSGITGGSCTKFAIKGTLPSHTDASRAVKDVAASTSDLMPATPHTRKAQSQGLFQGGSDGVKQSETPQSGSISITASKDTRNDESVIINCGGQSIYIPSILSYWKSEASGKGSFAASGSNSSVLPSPRTGGERINNVSLLPEFPKQQSALFGARTSPNILTSTSTRLLLLVSPLIETPNESEPAEDITQPLPLAYDNTDQSLLQQGVLDVDGMDRLLDGMGSPIQSTQLPASKSASRSGTKPNFGRSIGFAQDVDMDMTPDLPSPRTTSRLQISSKKPTGRRLFS